MNAVVWWRNKYSVRSTLDISIILNQAFLFYVTNSVYIIYIVAFVVDESFKAYMIVMFIIVTISGTINMHGTIYRTPGII